MLIGARAAAGGSSWLLNIPYFISSWAGRSIAPLTGTGGYDRDKETEDRLPGVTTLQYLDTGSIRQYL